MRLTFVIVLASLAMVAATDCGDITTVDGAAYECTSATGVHLHNGYAPFIRLPNLKTVTGDCVITGNAMSLLDLGSLQTVGRFLVISDNTKLRTFTAPVQTVSAGVIFKGNGNMELYLDSLTTVNGDVNLQGTFTIASFKALKTVALTFFMGNGSDVQEVKAPLLASAGTIFVELVSTVPSLEFPQLESLEQMLVRNNPHLQTLSFPALKKLANVEIYGNLNLEKVDLVSLVELDRVGGLAAIGKLISCQETLVANYHAICPK